MHFSKLCMPHRHKLINFDTPNFLQSNALLEPKFQNCHASFALMYSVPDEMSQKIIVLHLDFLIKLLNANLRLNIACFNINYMEQ